MNDPFSSVWTQSLAHVNIVHSAKGACEYLDFLIKNLSKGYRKDKAPHLTHMQMRLKVIELFGFVSEDGFKKIKESIIKHAEGVMQSSTTRRCIQRPIPDNQDYIAIRAACALVIEAPRYDAFVKPVEFKLIDSFKLKGQQGLSSNERHATPILVIDCVAELEQWEKISGGIALIPKTLIPSCEISRICSK